MKRIKLIILAALALMLISSCNKYEPDTRVALLLEAGNNVERWKYDKEYLQEALSWYSDLQISLYESDDADTQIKQLESVLKAGYSNIIITPINYDAINNSGLLEKYPDLNVVCHSRLIFDNSKISYFSSCDVEEIGRLQANYLIQYYLASEKETMTIEMFAGPDGDYTSTNIFAGAYDILKPYIDNGSLIIKSAKKEFNEVSLSEWSRTAAKNEMKSRFDNFYTDGSIPDLILAPNDDCAIGIINAIDERNAAITKYPAITGQDNSEEGQQYMKDGKLGMTVDLNIKEMCYNTASIIGSISKGTIPVTPYYINNGIINVPFVKCNILAIYKSSTE